MQVHVVIERRSEALQKGDGVESRASRARPVTVTGQARRSTEQPLDLFDEDPRDDRLLIPARSPRIRPTATLPADPVGVSRHRLTVAEFQRMGEVGILGPDDRVELIAGEVIDISPIGSLHAAIVRAIATVLTHHVREQALLAIQDPLALDDTSQPQPDLAVLRRRACRRRG